MPVQNAPEDYGLDDETWDFKKFVKKFKIVVVRMDNFEMEFDLIGIQPAFANAFRRLMLSEVPSMAIEKVMIKNNTSIIQDEVLAHRLGLIPLKADPRLFEYKSEGLCTNYYKAETICGHSFWKMIVFCEIGCLIIFYLSIT